MLTEARKTPLNDRINRAMPKGNIFLLQSARETVEILLNYCNLCFSPDYQSIHCKKFHHWFPKHYGKQTDRVKREKKSINKEKASSQSSLKMHSSFSLHVTKKRRNSK